MEDGVTSDVSRTRSPVEAARIDAEDGEPRSRALRHVLALVRLSIGWVFLWAFFDKLLALGFATSRDQETGVVDWFGPTAWINGGSPTEGFLGNATKGPLAGLYSSFAGAAWADWLFMAGLLGIGAGLMLGIAMRLSCGFGAAAVADVERGFAAGQQPVHGRPHRLRAGARRAGPRPRRTHARARPVVGAAARRAVGAAAALGARTAEGVLPARETLPHTA